MNDFDPASFPALKERLSAKELEEQIQLFTGKNLFTELLDSTPSYLVVLNKYRQIVYANKSLNDFIKSKDKGSCYGKRPGELLNCHCALLTQNGCGTSDFCDTCGALKAILSSLSEGKDVQECRIIQKDTNDALDLRVWSKELKINGQVFSIFSFIDISHEKRRMALERIFFHDVLNSACGLRSYISLFSGSSYEEIETMVPIVSELLNKLLEEIKSQRDLVQAENAELIVNLQVCNSLKMINDLNNLYRKQHIAEDKEIEIDKNFRVIDFISDNSLVLRVLSNMIKNALEATGKGGKIKISCNLLNDKVQFLVNNSGLIPKDIQQQIFQRSFSTKGIGRGLGTYSMKLITERYLKGKIFFKTSGKEGTTFTAEYPVKFN